MRHMMPKRHCCDEDARSAGYVTPGYTLLCTASQKTVIFVDFSQKRAIRSQRALGADILMLIAFRFKNFRSFAGDGELSLLSHRADKAMPDSLIEGPRGTRLPSKILPAIAIYGANSAGKTNVLEALVYLRSAITESHSTWRPNSGTRCDRFLTKAKQSEPMTIEADFICDQIRYSYGISANNAAFEEEWLYQYYKGKEIPIFVRRSSKQGKNYVSEVEFDQKFGGDETYRNSIIAKTRDNSLFLSTAAQDNHPICQSIYKWFEGKIELISLGSGNDRANSMATARLFDKEEDQFAKKQVLSLLQTIDPAIFDIRVEKSSGDEIPSFIKEVLENHAATAFQDLYSYKIEFVLKRSKTTIVLPYRRQSNGFKRFFSMCMDIIYALSTGSILLVDELEAGIHPHVARMVIEMFQNKDINFGRGQIIFTTHDTNILDQSLLRRDQIWFVEKNNLESRLYSLLEYTPRKDENLERGYLRGRYGAIPALGLDLSLSSAGPTFTE